MKSYRDIPGIDGPYPPPHCFIGGQAQSKTLRIVLQLLCLALLYVLSSIVAAPPEPQDVTSRNVSPSLRERVIPGCPSYGRTPIDTPSTGLITVLNYEDFTTLAFYYATPVRPAGRNLNGLPEKPIYFLSDENGLAKTISRKNGKNTKKTKSVNAINDINDINVINDTDVKVYLF